MTLILTLTLTQVRTLVAAAEFTGEASMECYKAGPLLGQGAFSKVYTGYHRLTGRKVALKQYDKVKLEKSPVLLAAVRYARASRPRGVRSLFGMVLRVLCWVGLPSCRVCEIAVSDVDECSRDLRSRVIEWTSVAEGPLHAGR